jgi:hypothetical protein
MRTSQKSKDRNSLADTFAVVVGCALLRLAIVVLLLLSCCLEFSSQIGVTHILPLHLFVLPRTFKPFRFG